MKKSITLAFATSALLLAGCNKSAPTPKSVAAQASLTDWGVIELSASNPKRLSLDGVERTFTGTPLADGKIALVIETVSLQQTVKMIVPPNVQYACYVGDTPVRFTVKLKAL